MVSLECFDQVVSEASLSPDQVELEEVTMCVIEYLLGCIHVNEFDFNSFNLRQTENALDHISWSASSEPENEEQENRDNMSRKSIASRISEWTVYVHRKNHFYERGMPHVRCRERNRFKQRIYFNW